MSKKLIRKPRGRILMRVDFTAVEARILAWIKGDPQTKIDRKHVRTGRISNPPKLSMKELGNERNIT